ncbi:MAG TPA: cell envelope integrity protein TolA, partial [Bdellovibrio sp.]|nr:cell envelope integrity protein TolA [Bdellovibrio sp.]
MKKLLKISFILVIFIIGSGFAEDDVVELEHALNGRDSANFLKTTDNVKFTLEKGARAVILKDGVKKFSSTSPDANGEQKSNYGLHVLIKTGPNAGKEAWIYYRGGDPGMKLFSKAEAAEKDAPLEARKPAESVEKAKAAEMTKPVAAIADSKNPPPAPDVKGAVAKAVKKADDLNKKELSPSCSDCELNKHHMTGSDEKTGHDKGVEASSKITPSSTEKSENTPLTLQDSPRIIPITQAKNPFSSRTSKCKPWEDTRVELCTYDGSSKPESFYFWSRSTTAPVDAGLGNLQTREWKFYFENGASQDMGFSIIDMPTASGGRDLQNSYIMLFPRKSVPNVRMSDGKQIVTLPTGETVTYDKNTRKVIGGVLKEDGPMSKGGSNPQPAKVSYHGTGVMVRV